MRRGLQIGQKHKHVRGGFDTREAGASRIFCYLREEKGINKLRIGLRLEKGRKMDCLGGELEFAGEHPQQSGEYPEENVGAVFYENPKWEC